MRSPTGSSGIAGKGSDTAIAAQLIRALLRGRAAGDVIEVAGE